MFFSVCESCFSRCGFPSCAIHQPTSFFSSYLWQDQFDMVSDADLQGLDAKIVALTAKVQSLQQSCRHMEAGRTGQSLEGDPHVNVRHY